MDIVFSHVQADRGIILLAEPKEGDGYESGARA